MNNGFNQLQGILQMAAFFQNPLSGANVPANSPLASSATTAQASQYQPPAPTTQPVPTQGGPNLLSLLGGHGNTLSAPLLGGLSGAVAGVGSCDNDEEVLVQALQESHHRDWTYRRALDNLHGVNIPRSSLGSSAYANFALLSGQQPHRGPVEGLLLGPHTANQ